MRQVPKNAQAMRINDFKTKKENQEKITFVTCYDFPSAQIISDSLVDCVLVGDSVAMTVHGFDSTIHATIEMMILHTEAVARGLQGKFLVTDLPFLCHRASLSETMNQVKRLLRAGAQAIKIEGGDNDTCTTIHQLVTAGVPVMGHIGLTPQSILQIGGYKVQGKNEAQAERLVEEAKLLEHAGCFALVIECVPAHVASAITRAVSIPTIGIGAGLATDGQVLVWHDLLGFSDTFQPRFVRRFAESKSLFVNSLNTYVADVQKLHFPSPEHSF